MRRRAAALLLAAASTSLAAAPAASYLDAAVDRTITDPRITESSSLVPSRLHAGVLWTANDSGDTSRIYAIGKNGTTVASYAVAGAAARDWEAMAPTVDAQGRPALLIGDIGDNSGIRTNGILLHLVTEPTTLSRSDDRPLTGPAYRLRYPDGPHDAEALAVDPRSHQVFVITKGLFGGSIYAAPKNLDPSGPNELTRVGGAPPVITDAAVLPDGRWILRDYSDAIVLRADHSVAKRLRLPDQPQGESIAVTDSGAAILVGSEGVDSLVYRMPLPADVRAAGSSATPTAAASDSAGDGALDDALSGNGLLWGAGGAVGLAVLIGLLGLTRRRR